MAWLPAVSFYSPSFSRVAAAAASIRPAPWTADLPRRGGKTISSRTSSYTHGRLGGWESKSPSRRNMHWAALFVCEILPGSSLAWNHTNCSCPSTHFPSLPSCGLVEPLFCPCPQNMAPSNLLLSGTQKTTTLVSREPSPSEWLLSR